MTGGRSLRSRSTGSKRTATSKSADTPFKQQRLFALRPILTPGCAIFLMLAMGLFFGTLGVLMIFTSEEVYEVESADYSASCCVENCSNDLWSAGGRRRDANPCAVTITVEEKMAPPVYMYYKVSNLYQNHRSYITSRDDKMLRGVEALGPEITCRSRYQCQDECSCDREGRGCNETLSVGVCSLALTHPFFPICRTSHSSYLSPAFHGGGAFLSLTHFPHMSHSHSSYTWAFVFCSGSADHIEPCGLMAWSVFNDTFAMRSSNGTQIPLRQVPILKNFFLRSFLFMFCCYVWFGFVFKSLSQPVLLICHTPFFPYTTVFLKPSTPVGNRMGVGCRATIQECRRLLNREALPALPRLPQVPRREG